MNPIVTAFITVYNEETWVERAVRSLLNQSLAYLEILVVDDGSTDRTAGILDAIDDQRLRVIHRSRSGRAEALAFATREARGRYLANLDADDEAHPLRLEKQAAFLESHPDHGWVGCAEHREDRQRGEQFVRLYPQEDAAIRATSARCIPYCHSGVMFRAEVVHRGLNYDPSQPFLIDFEFFLRVAQEWKVANLPAALVLRRVRAESYFQSTFATADQNRRLARLCARAIRRFRLPAWNYAYPALRLGYPLLPTSVKRCVRRCSGLTETERILP